MVVEDELKPFKREGGRDKTDEMRVHSLPWPDEALDAISAEEVRLRVTLSYFVEPNPGPRGPRKGTIKGRYSYPSHGLRFDVKTAVEKDDQFRKRVSKALRGDGEKSETSSRIGRWRLGTERNRGTIHSDVWEGTAEELKQKGRIVVYPVKGWWRYLKSMDRIERKVRYALVVSIETEDTELDVDFYTEIENQVTPEIDVEI